MLQREAELRRADEVQARYREVEASGDGDGDVDGGGDVTWMEVTVELQEQVCR